MPTETQPKHTHLQVLDGYDPPIIGWERGDGDHHVAEIIAQPDDANTDRFAARLVACVNACEGINPEAVPDLLAACKAAKDFVGSLESWKNSGDQGPEAFPLNQLLAAAIAKAEGRIGGGA